MGNSSSQSATLNDTIDIATKNMTNITQSAAQSAQAVSNISQSLTFNNYGDVTCPINAENTLNSTVDLQATSKTQFGSDISSLLKQAIDQTAQSGQANVQGFLASPFSSSDQTTNTNIQTAIKNITSTDVVQQNSQSCFAEFNGSQSLVVNNYGRLGGPACSFGNNLVSALAASCTMDGVSKAVASNQELMTTIQAAAAKQDSQQQGVNNLVDSIGKALSSILSGPAMIIAVIVIGGIAVLVVVSLILKGGHHDHEDDSDRRSRGRTAGEYEIAWLD